MKNPTRQTPLCTKNKVIVYDDVCPMCSLYTKAFVRTGMLQAENRIGFSQLEHDDLIGALDPVRARHEIPLLDRDGGPTLYGVDALVYILRQRLPFVAWGMSIPAVAACVRRLYAVISYNRRVIIPSSGFATGVDCTPDFHLGYRSLFIAFALLVFACALVLLFVLGFGLSVAVAFAMLLPVYGAIAIHGLLVRKILGVGAIEYAGHSAVTLLLFALPTILSAVIGVCVGEPEFIFAGAISGSVLLLWQHEKRMQYLKRSSWWTLSWVGTLSLGIAVAVLCC